MGDKSNKRGYTYWHICTHGCGFYAKRFADRVEVQPNGFDIPDLVMENATWYDVRKWIDECMQGKHRK